MSSKQGRKKGRTFLKTLETILNNIPKGGESISINHLAKKTEVTFYTVKKVLQVVEKAQQAPHLELVFTTERFSSVRFKVE